MNSQIELAMLFFILYIVMVPVFCDVYYHRKCMSLFRSTFVGMVWPLYTVYRCSQKFVNWIVA